MKSFIFLEQKNNSLDNYLDNIILPKYKKLDSGHNEEHIFRVYSVATNLNKYLKLDPNIVKTMVYFHDLGNLTNRETHHTLSAQLVFADKNLKKYFNEDELTIISNACLNHRSSIHNNDNNIYSLLLQDSDKLETYSDLDITKILFRLIYRAYNYSLKNYPEYTPIQHYNRIYNHLSTKFGYSGYAKYNLDISKKLYGPYIKESQDILNSEPKFKVYYDKFLQLIKK